MKRKLKTSRRAYIIPRNMYLCHKSLSLEREKKIICMCSSLMLATKNMKFVSIKLNFVNQNLPDTHTGVQYNCAHISRLLK